MSTSISSHTSCAAFEHRFRSLFDDGRGYSFPWDAAGRVDLDALSDHARSNFFFAHSVIGRDFATPAMRACGLH